MQKREAKKKQTRQALLLDLSGSFWIFLDLKGVIFLTSGPYHLCWFSRWSQVISAIVHTTPLNRLYCCHSWEPLSSHVVKSTLPRSTARCWETQPLLTSFSAPLLQVTHLSATLGHLPLLRHVTYCHCLVHALSSFLP